MQLYNNISLSAANSIIGTITRKDGSEILIKRPKVHKQNKTIKSVDHPGTIIVELSKGYSTIVSTETWNKVLRFFSWYSMTSNSMSGSIYPATSLRSIDGKQIIIPMHQMIMGQPPEGHVIDHENENSLDNTDKNLRFVTNSINRHNSSKRRYTKTGFKYVYQAKNMKYRVSTRIHKHTFCKDGFNTIEDAVLFRDTVLPMILKEYFKPEVK